MHSSKTLIFNICDRISHFSHKQVDRLLNYKMIDSINSSSRTLIKSKLIQMENRPKS
jgi:hypothetical protein